MKKLKKWGRLSHYFKDFIRIMKITIMLLVFSICSISASTYAQTHKISINKSNCSIIDILKEIEKKSEFTFFYNDNQIDITAKTSINITNATIEDILNRILKNTDYTYQVIDKQILIKQKKAETAESNQSPKKPVSGIVTDEKGEPVIGANIQIKGTSGGVVTDLNGKFTLSVTPNDVLKISYIGFLDQEIRIGDQKTLEIKLQEQAQKLDEVVVVGYGTQKKTSLTGAISQISNKELMQAPMPNISQSLAGRLPGLITRQESGQPGADGASLYIRGVGTWGDSTPMILVDGVERSFTNLDPNEIETVAILKDASAASVYGVKGANGVILVTTKRGIEQKAQISYSGSVTLGQNINFPEFLNGEEYARWYNYAEEMNDRIPLFSENDIEKIKYGDPDGYFGNTNWYDLLFKKVAVTHQHNISVNGGNKNVRYFLSIGYLGQDGTMERVSFDRYNLRSNVDVNITNDFSVSFDLSGRIEDRKTPGLSEFTGKSASSSLNIMTMMMAAHPYINATDKNGVPMASSISVKNPIAARDLSGTNKTNNSVFNGSLAFKYAPSLVKGLSLKFVSSYDLEYQNNKKFFTPFTLTVFDPRSKTASSNFGAGLGTLSQLTEGSYKTTRITFQEQINYARTYATNHNLGLLFVAEQSLWKTHGIGAYMRNFDFNDLPDFDFGKESPDKPNGYTKELPRVGFVARVNYDFARKYLVELSARADASTVFAKENRWGFFPAASVGWRISEESFIADNTDFIDNFKIRASAGILGNDRIEAFQYLRMMSLTVPAAVIGGKPVNGLYTSNIPNKDITWEQSYNYNAGFDLSLWRGMLSAEFDVYYKKTKDILTGVSSLYPPSVGGNHPSVMNMGIVDNKGFELVLGHTNQINEVTYSIRGNLSYSRNRILRTDESVNIPDYQRTIGNPIGQKMGFVCDGLFQTDGEAATSPIWGSIAKAGDVKYRDVNGDGKLTYDQDRVIIGKSNIPEMMFGLQLAAEWKGLDFSAFFQGAAICDVALMGYYPKIGWDDTQFTRPFYNNANAPRYLVEDSWTPYNTDAKYPRLDTQFRDNNNAASTLWVKNASYLRLKTAQIGYNIPSRLLRKANISALRIYVAGSNLFTISGLDYLDPESPDVNNGYYPQQRTYSLGLNLTF